MTWEKECPVCHKVAHSIGEWTSHKRCGESLTTPVKIAVDEFTEKPLSDLLREFKALLKPYQYRIRTVIAENNGQVTEVAIIVRFQIK